MGMVVPQTHKIELLGEELIDAHPDLAMEVLGMSSRLAMPLGWHYLLDLIWVLREIEDAEPSIHEPPFKMLEVGAGFGLLQFLLADRGYCVISADMRNRTPSAKLTACYDFRVLAEEDEIQHPYLAHLGDNPLRPREPRGIKPFIRKLLGRSEVEGPATGPARGDDLPKRPVIQFYRCNAEAMTAIPDASIDAAFSISALEHNCPELISGVQVEIERVTRPGGFCLHTVSATRKGQEFHEPSHSYLMDDVELARVFSLDSYETNWSEWDTFESRFQKPGRLARWLAHTYFQSGRNGMPWGVWRPEYLPVGLRKEF